MFLITWADSSLNIFQSLAPTCYDDLQQSRICVGDQETVLTRSQHPLVVHEQSDVEEPEGTAL